MLECRTLEWEYGASGEEDGMSANSPDCVSGIRLGIELGIRMPDFLVFAFVSGVGVLDAPPTTLLAGELPGVSTRLLAIERSLDIIVDTESRDSFSQLSLLISSIVESISRI